LKVELYMPEMATLDTFFNKLERRGSLSTAEQQKCKSYSDNEKNDKKLSRKRGRSCDSDAQTRRLQSKKQKRLDSNLNISHRCTSEVRGTPEVVSNCQSCSGVEVHDDRNIISVPSSTVEISYEEFLTSTGIAHTEASLDSSEDADSDTACEVKMSPVKMSLKHSDLATEPSVKSLKTQENSADDDEYEDNVLSNNSEVASKDIRCFFSKADKVSPQPVKAATFTKIKADIHCQHSQKSNTSKCIEGHVKRGSDLARRQRAAIVITDDDLDIEVIAVSRNDDDFQIDFPLEDNADITAESNIENHIFDGELKCTRSLCREISFNADDSEKSTAEHDSVSVATVTHVAKSADTERKLSLRTAKLEKGNVEASVQTSEEAVLHSQKVDCDLLHLDEDKCSDESDEVVVVEEKIDEVDSSSVAEPSATDTADEQSSVSLATELRKPKQVRYLRIYLY